MTECKSAPVVGERDGEMTGHMLWIWIFEVYVRHFFRASVTDCGEHHVNQARHESSGT